MGHNFLLSVCLIDLKSDQFLLKKMHFKRLKAAYAITPIYLHKLYQNISINHKTARRETSVTIYINNKYKCHIIQNWTNILGVKIDCF